MPASEPSLDAAADDLGPRLLAAGSAVSTIALLLALWLAAALSGSAALRSPAPYAAAVGAGTTLTVALALRARRRQTQVWRLVAVSRPAEARGGVDAALARRLELAGPDRSPLLSEFAATAGFEGLYGWVSTSEAFTKALERLRGREPAVLAELLAPRRLDDEALRRLERDPVVTDAFFDVLRLQPWLARRLGWSEERVSATFGAPPIAPRRPRPEPERREASPLLARAHGSGKALLAFTALCGAALGWSDRFTTAHPFAIPAFLLAVLLTLCLFPVLTSPDLPLRRTGSLLALGALALGAAAQLALAAWAVAVQLR